MYAEFNYDSVIKEQQIDLSPVFKKINFYLSNNPIAKIFRRLGAIEHVRKDIKILTDKARTRMLISAGVYVFLNNELSEFSNKDLTKQIQTVENSINTLIQLKGGADDFTIRFGNKLLDFSNLQFYINQILEGEYRILALLKKANKKTLRPTSDLAKQTSEYSLNNLSNILNAH